MSYKIQKSQLLTISDLRKLEKKEKQKQIQFQKQVDMIKKLN